MPPKRKPKEKISKTPEVHQAAADVSTTAAAAFVAASGVPVAAAGIPGGSDDSPPSSEKEFKAGKARNIIVRSRVRFTKAPFHVEDVEFEVNAEQRPDTLLDGQGDHSTSYLAIIQGILSSTHSLGIRRASQSLSRFVERMFDVQKVKDTDFPKEPVIHTREVRQKVEEKLDGEEYKEQVDQELKYTKMSLIADHMAETAEYFLKTIQKDELTTFHSRGRMGKNPNEGNLAKEAVRALIVLDELCLLSQMNPDTKEFSKRIASLSKSLTPRARSSEDSEDDHIMRLGIGVWYKSDGGLKFANRFKAFIDAHKSNREIQEEVIEIRNVLLERRDQMAGFIGNLLDYNRVLEFDLQKGISLTDKEKSGDFASQNLARERKIEGFFDPDEHKIEIRDDKHKGQDIKVATVTRTSEDILIKVLSKHKKVMQLAFPNFADSSSFYTIFEDVFNKFLAQIVLVEQGWREHKYESDKDQTKSLELTDLCSMIESLEASRGRGIKPGGVSMGREL